MSVDLRLGDCLTVMAGMAANSVDTIITDPPYGLEFMGKEWDHGVPGVAFWEEALRVAKPGAMMLCFGGDRTHHRLMVAIEDAGWEIRTCMYWIFGSGFPKSLNISKAIGKMAPPSDPAKVAGQVGSVDTGLPASFVGASIGAETVAMPLTEFPADGADRHGPHSGCCSLGGKGKMQGGVEQASGQSNPEMLGSLGVTGFAEGDEIVPSVGSVEAQPETLGDQVVSAETSNCPTVNASTVSTDNLGRDGGPSTTFVGAGFPPPSGVPLTAHAAAVINRHAIPRTVDGLGSFSGDGLATSPTDESVCFHKPDYTTERQACQAAWAGYGTALKPAVEIIVLAMKPRDGTFANNALKWGVAGIWVDGARVGLNGEKQPTGSAKRVYRANQYTEEKIYGDNKVTPPSGRFPANLVLSHSPGCRQVGVRKVRGDKRGSGNGIVPGQPPGQHGIYGTFRGGNANTPAYGDPDGTETVPAYECVEGCPVAMLDEQSGESTSSKDPHRFKGHPKFNGTKYASDKYSLEWESGDVPVYGDKGGASRFFYQAKAGKRERWFYCPKCDDAYPMSQRGEHADHGDLFSHPTQKPLGLMRYLAKLTRTPTGGTVLDMFMGTGTTGEACVLEGRPFIGIEREYPSHKIAQRRIESAQSEMVQLELTNA